MTAPVYYVRIYTGASSYGIGAQIVEFDNAKNVGIGWYLNDVHEAFFTISQDDPKLAALYGHEGRAHVRIYRDSDVVYAGWAAMEHDATSRDVIFYCYSYISGLYWTASDWNKQYTNATVGTIVSDQWTWAKTTTTDSRLGFVTTGTIESPVTATGGSTAITLPAYGLYYKRILTVMREMAALGISDTTNRVVFEITHATAPTFNFWKNRGTTQTSVIWSLGDSIVKDFREWFQPVYHRNEVLAVGSAPNNTLLRYDRVDTGDSTTWGRMQEPLYFSWVRDQTELTRATNLRGALGVRSNIDLQIEFKANSVLPPGATGAGFKLSDQVRVKIARGITSIDTYMLVTGAQVVWRRGNEKLNVLLEQPSGS